MNEPRQQTAPRLAALLEPGRAQGIEEGLVGGILTLLGRRVMRGEASELAGFTPSVIEFALAPYLGAERAREVAAREA